MISWYSKQLQDPRWKAKRLVILARDGYKCTKCGKTENLHVHHTEYSGLPWEVEDRCLITLCKGCHFMEEFRDPVRRSSAEPAFIKVYPEGLKMFGKCTAPEFRVLYKLLQSMSYDRVVLLPTGVKKAIAKELDTSINWVSTCVAALVQKGAIVKQSGGVYIVNRNCFYKGIWKPEENQTN